MGGQCGMMGGWLIFWIVIIFGVVVVIKWLTRFAPPSDLHILKKRYAKGEIGKDEFEEKKKDLM